MACEQGPSLGKSISIQGTSRRRRLIWESRLGPGGWPDDAGRVGAIQLAQAMPKKLAGRCEARPCNLVGEADAHGDGRTMRGTFVQYSKQKKRPRSWPTDAMHVREIQPAKIIPTEFAGRCEPRSCNTSGKVETHRAGRTMRSTFVQHSGQKLDIHSGLHIHTYVYV